MKPDCLQQAFLLHRRDYSDSSLLLEVFTAEHGRLPLLAKGAKRGRAPAAALLQPFNPLLLAWTGRGEVRTLTRVEAAGRPLGLAGTALYCGLYVNELLMRLLARQDAHQALFVFYQVVLDALATAEDLQTPLRQFELRLLAELGYQVTLDRERSGNRPVDPDAYYVYSNEHGVVPAPSTACAGAVRGETLRRLGSGEVLSGVLAREARDLLRELLAPHLGDRPLRSRELFNVARPRAGA